MSQIQETPEYQEGEHAFLAGKNTRDNPYPICSEQAFRWQEGLLGAGESGNRILKK